MVSDLFRIECFVNDRRLGDVLRALAGSGAFNVTPTPVSNVEEVVTKNEQKKELKASGDGSLYDLVLRNINSTEFTTANVSHILKTHGHHASNSVRIIQRGVKEGVFKRNKVRGHYILT